MKFMSKSNRCRNWVVLMSCMAALSLAFGIGLIIGIFAVPDFDDSGCRYDALIGDEDDRIRDLFMRAVDAGRIEANLQHLSSKIHRAGTPGGNAVAQFIHDSFLDYGLDKVEFEEYYAQLSYPNETNPDQVTLVDSSGKILVNISNGRSKTLYSAEESLSPNADIRFNGFAKAGQVKTAKLVYANYGTREDFDYLINKANISLDGAIVLIRYRKLWRGAKVEVAEQLGAAGVLLYSDPKDETYQNQTSEAATYPNTIYMPSSAVQRGAVTFKDYGDILTPLLPSKDYVIRHTIQEMYDTGIISKIPVTPISYSDAEKLFRVLEGSAVPKGWQGGLPIQYRLGPNMNSNTNVQMTVTTYLEQRTVRNVIGYIRGDIEPDRYVVIGNHHDAWVYGAMDPSSGTAVMLEVARALASVANSTGWRPRRTIVFCAWDAEEYGLIGSSEFVEQYLRRLEAKTIAYLNVDIGVTGNETIWAKSVPLLKKALFKSAAKVENPNPVEVEQGRKTVYDTWLHKMPDKKNPGEPLIDSIGSGSDYRHFLDYAGIASLDFRYTQTADRSYHLYHTMHETMHLVRLTDPTFSYHQAVTRMWGEMARYLSDSLFIPFNTTDYAHVMLEYISDLETFVQKSPAGSYANITHIKKAADAFLEATIYFEAKKENAQDDVIQIRVINDQLMNLERMFILPFGLPGRSFLRHVIFAPSIDDSYAGVNFAGITDTMNQIGRIEAKKMNGDTDHLKIVLNDQISWVAHCIYSAVDLLKRDL